MGGVGYGGGMTLRLTVDRAAWTTHVQATTTAYGHGLVPVVKGNGYGFGRPVLHEVASSAGARYVCVGDLHELHDVPATLTPVVLTPTLAAPNSTKPILTVGDVAHVQPLRDWGGSVMVKLRSSMHRYGVAPAELGTLLDAVHSARLHIAAFAIHLPLAGTDADRVAEVEAWLPHLDPAVAIWVSHLSPARFHALRHAHPDREWFIRVGTAMWHGAPKGPFFRLEADVLSVQPVHAGQMVGYRATPAPFDGTLVSIGAGTAAGVASLEHADPAMRSPFHFARRRLEMLEPPHMHTSLVVVPTGAPCPVIGEHVDVQRPLTTTSVHEVVWQ